MDKDLRESARQRLEILDAVAAAVERRAEVLDLIAASPSADHARAAVADLLGVSEIGATAVLDLQWRRLAGLERNRMIEERDAIRADLD